MIRIARLFALTAALALLVGGTMAAVAQATARHPARHSKGAAKKKHKKKHKKSTSVTIKCAATTVTCVGKQGPQGTQGVPGTNGTSGAAGDKGDKGDAGPLPGGTLPSGKTLRGFWGAETLAANANDYVGQGLSFFGYALPANPTIQVILSGATPPSGCPGTEASPAASPGNMCIYESSNNANRENVVSVCNLGGPDCKYGVVLVVYANVAGNFWSYGTWAVTAP